MKIWRLEADLSDYETIQFVNKDSSFLTEFESKISRGKYLNGELDNLEVEIIDVGKYSDNIKLWNGTENITLSEKAKECLKNELDNCVEFIPVRLNERILYIINILNILDVVDYQNSIFKKLDTGLVVGFEKYAFIHEKVQGAKIFKILLNGRIRTTEVFVSSEIKDIIEKNNLEGFCFEEIWDSEV